jgi:hypothetical protein
MFLHYFADTTVSLINKTDHIGILVTEILSKVVLDTCYSSKSIMDVFSVILFLVFKNINTLYF